MMIMVTPAGADDRQRQGVHLLGERVSSVAVADRMSAILPTLRIDPTLVTIMTPLPWVTGVCMNAMFVAGAKVPVREGCSVFRQLERSRR